VYIQPGGSATIQWRTYDGIATGHNISLPSSRSPAFLRLVGWLDSRFKPPRMFVAAMTSTDGVRWAPVLGSTVPMAFGSSYLAGLAATGGGPGLATSAMFDRVAVNPVTAPPPGICPAGWSCTDVGSPAELAGNQLDANGRWVVQGSGQIWSLYDSFRFVYRSLAGDGRVTARVASQTAAGAGAPAPWMRSGVMVRAGIGAEAPYFAVLVTPGHGASVQWRTSAGTLALQVIRAGLKAPAWVRVVRHTSPATKVVSYTAYVSSDGVTFTAVPGATVVLNLTGPLVAGIAVDANSSTALADATFDHVALLAG
jgi:hypothetical protein